MSIGSNSESSNFACNFRECSKSLSCSAPGAISDLPKPASSGSVESMLLKRRRVSKDSAMEEENCRSLSGFTDSTEQSAPINFDMSNRVRKIPSNFIFNFILDFAFSRQSYHVALKIFDRILRTWTTCRYSFHCSPIVRPKRHAKCSA